jgi:hypothetical protein
MRKTKAQARATTAFLDEWEDVFGGSAARQTLNEWPQPFASRYLHLLDDRTDHHELLAEAIRDRGLFDCFSIAKWRPNENRLSDVIAALFDPGWGHEYWLPILKSVLAKLHEKAPGQPIASVRESLDGMQARVRVRREVRGSMSRADIDIYGPDFVVRIEHKLRGGSETIVSGEPQTNRLARDAGDSNLKTILVYLSPEGGRSEKRDFIPLSFRELAEAVAKALGLVKLTPIQASIVGFIDFYGRRL